jgi:cytoskeletal protein RodZ
MTLCASIESKGPGTTQVREYDMSKLISWLEQAIACFLILLLLVPCSEAATTQLPSAPAPQLNLAANAPQSSPSGTQPVQAQSSGQDQQTQAAPQPAPASQQNPSPAPVGTAVAPMVRPEGSAASRPAGAAIAPAKQRRTRTFAIRVALLVGAGIAIGTVTAATLGSPSHPPR